jgi:hypothetical protein
MDWSEQRDQVVSDIPASATFLEVVAGGTGKAQGIIQFSDGQETGVGGDGRAVKFQADAGIELEPERGLFAVTHWVPPGRLRYSSISGEIIAQL